MKRILTTVALTTALFAGKNVTANIDEYVPSYTGEFDEQSMQMHNDQMEAHLEEMRTLIQELQATNDPAERRRLLIEHRTEMAEMMGNMRSTLDDMTMGIMGGGPEHVGTTSEKEKRRQYMIEKRLDMIDYVMEMMMLRDEIMMDHY